MLESSLILTFSSFLFCCMNTFSSPHSLFFACTPVTNLFFSEDMSMQWSYQNSWWWPLPLTISKSIDAFTTSNSENTLHLSSQLSIVLCPCRQTRPIVKGRVVTCFWLLPLTTTQSHLKTLTFFSFVLRTRKDLDAKTLLSTMQKITFSWY